MAAWTFENSLAHGAAAPGVIAQNASEAGLAAAGAWTGDRVTGAACREYYGSGTGTPASPSRISFTVTATGNTTLMLHSARWWSKARSTETGAGGTHTTAKLRLYWSSDAYTSPISPESNPRTETQIADGWSGPWTPGSASFATPLVLTPGQSVTFRLDFWDETGTAAKRLRLDDFQVLGSATPGPPDAFDALRGKWKDSLTGGPGLDPLDPVVASRLASITSAATNWSNSLNRAPDRANLWSDIASTTISSQFNENYVRLRAMALAHATPGTALHGNMALRDDILGGLDWMRANRYHAGKARYDNWWHWEIGSPQILGDILILMYDELGTTRLAENLGTLAFFAPGSGGWMTGANRSDKCLAVAVHGLLSRQNQRLLDARDQLTPVFPYVAAGDGFRTDGSFIQHTAFAYTGSYGTELIKGVARLYARLQDTPWELTDPQHEILFEWIEKGYAPLYFRGAMPDHVRGRAISRQGSTDHGAGHTILRHILAIANAAPPEKRAPLRAWVKEQAVSDTSRNFRTASSLPDYPAARDLMLDPDVPLTPPPPRHIRFQEMDRVVHRRPGHAFGLAMSSSRIYTYESINQENLRGWFTGDGMLSFHNSDLTQFENDYWCTIDPYHLPGVTNPTGPRADASGQQKFTGQDWVGGTGLAEYGSAGMRLNTWTADLTAGKSWFFLDNEVVCLGADINGSSASPVHTTIENRRLSNAAGESLVIDGMPMPTGLGWQQSLNNPSWLALQGTGGIWFPSPLTLQIKREARTAAWYDINRGGPTTPVTRNWMTAWIDHGAAPSNAGYAYVLLPDADAAATAAYAAAPEVEILANDSAIQSVRDSSTGITAANFWGGTGGTTGGISSNGPCAVLVKSKNGVMEVAVSDPTWKRTAPLVITLSGFASGLKAANLDPAITAIESGSDWILTVNVNGTRGRSLIAGFSPLVARDDFASIAPGEVLLLDALANDGFPAGIPRSFHGIDLASHGEVAIRGGAIRYQPDDGFTGTDHFTYQIATGGVVSTATVRVEVATSPSAPVPTVVSATDHDGNVPSNTLDGSLATRWSSQGLGKWISFDFGEVRSFSGISLAFHLGNTRTATFAASASLDGETWSPILGPVTSSGTTLAAERYDFPTPVFARHLRITGYGNSQSTWNSITEINFFAHRNTPPVSAGISAFTPEATTVAVDFTTGATDADSGPASPVLLHFTRPVHSVANGADNTFAFTPATGFMGEEEVTFQISDGHRASEAVLRIGITDPTTLAGFLNRHFTASDQQPGGTGTPSADADNDGMANLVEYALGSDPRQFTAAPAAFPTPDGFSLECSIARLAGGVGLTPEWSDDLATWRAEGITTTIVEETPTARKVRFTIAPGAEGQRFLRLRASTLP